MRASVFHCFLEGRWGDEFGAMEIGVVNGPPFVGEPTDFGFRIEKYLESNSKFYFILDRSITLA